MPAEPTEWNPDTTGCLGQIVAWVLGCSAGSLLLLLSLAHRSALSEPTDLLAVAIAGILGGSVVALFAALAT